MDLQERIEQLEKQVSDLTALVADLKKKSLRVSRREARRQCRRQSRQMLTSDVRQNVNRILGGESGDTLETQIGGIWLSRVTMVLIMTAIVLGARVTFYTEVLGPLEKVGITYAGSLLAIGYGLLSRKNRDFFPQTLLGTGLAGIYFATYAGFYVDGMSAFASWPDWTALILLPACLLILVAVAHWRKSQTVAGISLFLAYYTVVASCMGGRSAENIYYAFLTCAVLAAVALAFHVLHRWLLFSWGALVATYATYFFFFLREPTGLALSGKEYFWLSGGFLSVCYVLFSCACIIDARRTGEYRRTVAQMAGVNSAIFLCLSWVGIREHYVEYEWMFRLGIAGLLLAFAAFAAATGPRKNYLFQIYIAKTLVMFTLALQAYFAGEKLMVAIAVESLGLAFSYKRSGLVVFKVLGLLLLLATFVGCLFHVKTPGITPIGPFEVPSNWFCCAGTAITLMVVSWFYERFVRHVPPQERVVKSQWFLADTFLDVHSSTAAILYAAAASIILLTITIIDIGMAPRLPYILASEGVIVSLAGAVFFAPQVEVGGVLLLAAAHVCYYLFLALEIPDFEFQSGYRSFTVAVSLFTFAGAYFWERYLRRAREGRAWEHHAAAAIPYLAATAMLATLISRTLEGVNVSLAQNSVAVVVLLFGAVLAVPSVKAAGLLALCAGTITFVNGVRSESSFFSQPGFFLYFAAIVVTYVLAERMFKILERRDKALSRIEDFVRTAIVATGASLAATVLSLITAPEHLTLYWIGLGVCAVTLGALLREIRYRWAALIIFAISIARAFQHDFWRLTPLYAFVSFASLAVALLIVAWLYSRYRRQTLQKAVGPDKGFQPLVEPQLEAGEEPADG